MKDLVWTEKYRPQTMEELIISDEDKTKIKAYISNPQSMPNLLLVGLPGVGKTTLADMIPKLINCPRGDHIKMNSSDDRKIDAIRKRILPFITSKRKSDSPKIIHMDEVDGLPTLFQDAMRGYTEGKYNKNCKFIWTANNLHKIILPLQERFVIFDLAVVPKQKLYDRMYDICMKEKLQFTVEGIKKLVDINYPSRRRMVATLQKLKDIGITEETVKTEDETSQEFYTLLKQCDQYKTRKFVIDNGLEPRQLLKQTLENIYNDTSINNELRNSLTQYAVKIEIGMSTGADTEIVFSGFIFYFSTNFKK